MTRTLSDFKSDDTFSSRVRELLLDNLQTQCKRQMVLNLFTVEFDFTAKKVTIFYYVNDKEYPDEIMTLDGFRKFLK